MWKVGDKIKFVENGGIDSTEEEGLIKGEIYEIVDRQDAECNDDGEPMDDPYEYVEDGYKYFIRLKGHGMFCIEPNSFEKVTKKKAVKESDYLDNIQYNFKFGY